MKKFCIVILILSTFEFINAQGCLKGKITDGKEPISDVYIILESGGKVFATANSDLDGRYTIKPITAGEYVIRVSIVEFQTQIATKIFIQNDKIIYQDFNLDKRTMDSGLLKFKWEDPTIDKNNLKPVVETNPKPVIKDTTPIIDDSDKDNIVYSSQPIIEDLEEVRKELPATKLVNTNPKLAHLLTAGEINDFTKWTLWNDISMRELKQYASFWEILPENRFCVQLTNKKDNPVVDATVTLLDNNNNVVWKAKTDNTGKAELWSCLFSPKGPLSISYSIEIEYHAKKYIINHAISFSQGINIKKIPVACESSNNIDVMFVVDATGSMGDEMNFLKAELLDIITNVQNTNKNLSINLGAVFYRDKEDEYLTRKSDFSGDLSQSISFIDKQSAFGGGDYQELVEEGLNEAIANCNWRSEARTRILFLVLDAPPQASVTALKKLQSVISIAAQKGIRIIPISGSGISKSTEYLLRSMALATNGTYTFLTDDSGIGGSHIKPTTDSYKVELLNDLIIRLFAQYTAIPTCNKPIEFAPTELIPDTSFLAIQPDKLKSTDTTRIEVISKVEVKPSWKCFPNPTGGTLTVEITGPVVDLFITDNAGKILEKVATNYATNIYNIELRSYPNGIYFLRYYYGKDQSVTAKIILTR